MQIWQSVMRYDLFNHIVNESGSGSGKRNSGGSGVQEHGDEEEEDEVNGELKESFVFDGLNTCLRLAAKRRESVHEAFQTRKQGELYVFSLNPLVDGKDKSRSTLVQKVCSVNPLQATTIIGLLCPTSPTASNNFSVEIKVSPIISQALTSKQVMLGDKLDLYFHRLSNIDAFTRQYDCLQ